MGSFPETCKGGFVQFFARSKISPDPCKLGLSDDVFFYNIRILQSLLRRKTTYSAKRLLKKKTLRSRMISHDSDDANDNT